MSGAHISFAVVLIAIREGARTGLTKEAAMEASRGSAVALEISDGTLVQCVERGPGFQDRVPTASSRVRRRSCRLCQQASAEH